MQGQTFTPNKSGKLTQSIFRIGRNGTVTGNVVSKLYNISGTSGVDARRTGTALGTSGTYLASSIIASSLGEDITFNFSGADQYDLIAGSTYAITIEYSGGDASNNLWPLISYGNGHPGNWFLIQPNLSVMLFTGIDLVFSVLASVNGTMSAVSTTDAGFTAGHPFASGAALDYTVQTALAGDIYYWRVRAIDPTGTNTYGAWSSVRSFTIATGYLIKYYTGTVFAQKPLKYYTGSTWATKPLKVYTGTEWKLVT
jgi:hypothetical protein